MPAQVSADHMKLQELLCGELAPGEEAGHRRQRACCWHPQIVGVKDWGSFPGAQDAFDNEANGLVRNGTWTFDEAISEEGLLANEKNIEHIYIASLMTTLSIKHWETPEIRTLKARIVFRGDHIPTEDKSKSHSKRSSGANNLARSALRARET